MRIVTEVFAQIEVSARTPEEIAKSSGVKFSRVIEVLNFLEDFGLVEAKGHRFKVSGDLAVLPRR